MKIKIDAQNLIDEQKKSQERCIELIGKGTFKTIDLEKKKNSRNEEER